MTCPFTIVDDLGNEAEAEDIESARTAAKTLVHDGADIARIYRNGTYTHELARMGPYGVYLQTI